MKKNEIIKLITFPLLAGLIILLISQFLFVPINNNLNNYSMFYKEEKNSLDVVLIGNSTVRSGFIPAHAWQNHGFTSFLIAEAPTHPEVIKIALKEISHTQKPKVVYVDINGLTYQKKTEAKGFVEKYIDSMPNNKRKDGLIKEFNYPQKGKDRFFKHHNQFRNPDYFTSAAWKYSNKHAKSIMKGYRAMAYSVTVDSVLTPDDTILPLPKDGMDYLSEILEICKTFTDTDFIFGKMPRFLTRSNINATYQLRSAKPIIEGYGYKFIDFYDHLDEIGLDNTTDQYDEEHLNHNGATKFTRFFSRYLKDEYNVGGTHSKSVTKNYNHAYEKYSRAIKKTEDNLLKPQDNQRHFGVSESTAFRHSHFKPVKIILPVTIVAAAGITLITVILVRRKRRAKQPPTTADKT